MGHNPPPKTKSERRLPSWQWASKACTELAEVMLALHYSEETKT